MSEKAATKTALLAAIHLLLGVLLIFLTPLLRWFMDNEIANLFSFHGITPLVPCLGLGWMLVGTRIMTGRRRWYRATRMIHVLWLCILGCVAVFGLAMIGIEVATANNRPHLGAGVLIVTGIYLLVVSAIMSALSIGVLILLRSLIRDTSGVQSQEPNRRIHLANSLAAVSVFLGVASVGWQVANESQRQAELRQLHEQKLQTLAYDAGKVRSLVFSPDGKYLATATDSLNSKGGVRIWDVTSGALHQEFGGALNCLSLAFTNDSAFLIVCHENQWNSGGFTVYDMREGFEVFRNSEHRTSSVAISDDGQFLVACGNAGYGKNTLVAPFTVWNLATFTKVFESAPKYGYVSAAFSASQTRLAVRRQKAIEIWPIPMDASSTLIRSWDPRISGNDVTAVTFCGDDTKVAASGVFGSKVWSLSVSNDDPDDPSDLPTVGPTNTGTFSDDGSLAVVANQDQLVQVIDLETETLFHEFKAPFWVEGLAISSDKKLIAVGGQKQVVILDANTGALVKELAQRDRL